MAIKLPEKDVAGIAKCESRVTRNDFAKSLVKTLPVKLELLPHHRYSAPCCFIQCLLRALRINRHSKAKTPKALQG